MAQGRGRRGRLRDADAGGEMVSPSKLPSWSTSVAPGSESMAWPQDEQNFAFAGTFVPQAEQNMSGSKFITRSHHRENAAKGFRKCAPLRRPCRKQELR